MFPDSLSGAAQLHVPFEASLHLSHPNFHFYGKKTGKIPHVCLSQTESRGGGGGETGAESERKREQSLSPVEMSCSCDQCPTKVRLQRCIFSSDGSQDRQIMRSWVSPVTEDARCLAHAHTHTGTISLSQRKVWERNNCLKYIISAKLTSS